MARKDPNYTCQCGTVLYVENLSGRCRKCMDANLRQPAKQVEEDRERQRQTVVVEGLKIRYKESLKTIERLEKELSVVACLKGGLDTYTIEPLKNSKSSEGTAVWNASDWHIEEKVGGEIGGLNVFGLEIARQRSTRFFQIGLRLTNILNQDISIKTVVLALLGDFITNDIHEAENAEVNELLPMFALLEAENMIISGIDFVIAHSTYDLVIPCHSGNHARTTHKTRFTTENGHSLEYLMYMHLADHYRDQPRVTFIIPEGMHSYVEIYDTMIRFHHGHAIKYQGGVGGIYIPTNKAIAQWNKGRHADLDVFGHFHQLRDGGNFICNGSLIGYNAFALSIKADYEPPKQAFFLVDRDRGRTWNAPILVGLS